MKGKSGTWSTVRGTGLKPKAIKYTEAMKGHGTKNLEVIARGLRRDRKIRSERNISETTENSQPPPHPRIAACAWLSAYECLCNGLGTMWHTSIVCTHECDMHSSINARCFGSGSSIRRIRERQERGLRLLIVGGEALC